MASTSRKRRRSSAGTSKGHRHRVSRSRRHSPSSRSRSSSHKRRYRHRHKHKQIRSRKSVRKQQPQNVEPTSDVPQKLSVSFAEPESTEAVPYSEKNSASSDNAVTNQPTEKSKKKSPSVAPRIPRKKSSLRMADDSLRVTRIRCYRQGVWKDRGGRLRDARGRFTRE